MRYKFDIKFIKKELATEFVRKYHYSPTMPYITKYYLGCYIENDLKGIVTLGYGTQPRHTFNKMFPYYGVLEKNNNQFILNLNDVYFEIGKLCISSDLNNTNAGSQLLFTLVKWIKQNTKANFLYTLADGLNKKYGVIYQASNFYYGGKYKTYAYLINDNQRIHPKTFKSLYSETTNYKKIYGYMFRYLYPINRKARIILYNESSMKWSKIYPKIINL